MGMNDKLADILTRHIHNERIFYARRYYRRFRIVLVTAFAVLIAIPSVFLFLIGATVVRGSSMNPYYQKGDLLVYTRVNGSYNYGDVAVFEYAGETLQGRVIGLAGDRINVSSDSCQVTVNGRELAESYAVSTGRHSNSSDFPLTVPENTLFLMGDNRDLALDSRNRNLGPVPMDKVRGKILFMIRTKRSPDY